MEEPRRLEVWLSVISGAGSRFPQLLPLRVQARRRLVQREVQIKEAFCQGLFSWPTGQLQGGMRCDGVGAGEERLGPHPLPSGAFPIYPSADSKPENALAARPGTSSTSGLGSYLPCPVPPRPTLPCRLEGDGSDSRGHGCLQTKGGCLSQKPAHLWENISPAS